MKLNKPHQNRSGEGVGQAKGSRKLPPVIPAYPVVYCLCMPH